MACRSPVKEARVGAAAVARGADCLVLDVEGQYEGRYPQASTYVAALRSNTFEVEWPPRSGVMRTYPEIDRAAWFSPDAARAKLLRGQVPLVDDLLGRLVPPEHSSG